MELEIFKSLLSLNDVEKQQQKNHYVSDDLPPTAIDSTATHASKIPVLNDHFFNDRNVSIRKHNRFAPYPLHTHQFMEINYMLRGHAHEEVDGTAITLSEGDVLLLDIGSQHRIDTLDQNDLMINILFRDRSISLDLLNQIQATRSVLYDFLVNRVSKNTNSDRYLLFKNQGSGGQQIHETLDSLIEEYYSQNEFSDTIINSLLTVLIARLIRNNELPATASSETQMLAVKILNDIRVHYQKLSLQDLADKYSYNKNYLSNLFKQEVGRPFSEVLTEERLLRAREMIQSTAKPIGTISQEVGLSNKSFFYHRYAQKFGHSPKEDRQQAHQQSILETL